MASKPTIELRNQHQGNFLIDLHKTLSKLAKLSVFTLCLCWFGVAGASGLTPFEAKYQGYRWGKELGNASIVLESFGRDRYKLSYNSKASFLFLSDKRKEVSLFVYKDGNFLPYKYSFERSGTGSDKSTDITFDRVNNQILVSNQDPLPLDGQLDNQIYRLALQQLLASKASTFEFDIVNDRGTLRTYKMKTVDTESLKLPYGEIEAVKVKIVRENKKRETVAWFAPSLNYAMVRLQQFKDGEEQIDIQLSEYSQTTKEQ